MRFSEAFLDELAARNDIVDVVSSYVELKRKGANYFGLCPFHSEKTPSFSVAPDKQMYHCFCLLYTSPSPRDSILSRMPSSA